MRPTLGAALFIASAALLTPSCARLDWFRHKESPQECPAGPVVGAPAPEIDGVDFQGQRVKLSDYRGKVVVVVFWASRCPPCRAMIPHERELVERYRDKPFALIGVNLDQNPEKAQEIMLAQHMDWPIVKTAGTDTAYRAYGVSFIPAVYVIDPAGTVRAAHVTGPALDGTVANLLAEMDAKRRP